MRHLSFLLLATLVIGCGNEHERNKNLKDAPDRPLITDNTAKLADPPKPKEKEKDKKPAEKDKEKKPVEKEKEKEKDKKPVAPQDKEKK